MAGIDSGGIDAMVSSVLEQDENYHRGLRMLLDWKANQANHYIAVSTRMGASRSYILSVSLHWISEHVYYARDLPIFKAHKREGSEAISINAGTVDVLQQREPDYRRQLPMTLYLAARRHHKFPPLLLVGYQDWVYDPNSDRWDADGRALEPSLEVAPLDSKSAIVDLDVTRTQYFTLDGQHRLMAIKGLKALMDGRLNAKSRDGRDNPRKSMTREQIEDYIEELAPSDRISSLQGLMDETVGIEIMPAVQAGETFLEAVARLRRVFVDVNQNAQRLERGELSLLDEDNGFRIVARILMTRHKLFRMEGSLRVDTKNAQLSVKSNAYTTLSTIVEIAEEFLGQKSPFDRWKSSILGYRGAGMLAPDLEEIDEGVGQLSKYFDAMADLPSHREMIEGADVVNLRHKDGGDSILFRPIAQVAIASAISSLQTDDGMEVEELMQKLAQADREDGLKLTEKTNPWFGVLCDHQEKIRRQITYRNLCTELLQYLLGRGFVDKGRRDSLKGRFFWARCPTSDEPHKAIDTSGALVSIEDFLLPAPWH